MRSTTTVFARFESKGKPSLTQTLENKPIREVTLEFASWLLTVAMGSHIKCTIARSLPELEQFTKSGVGGADTDLMGELESLLDQTRLPLDNTADSDPCFIGDDE